MASEIVEELLFFDTFSHDSSEEINLDLVQFPKPVIISEIRIIPLGARVQADFPGGVRLGATNPSQFHIEFFVNDLSKPGASTFEIVGGLEYRQNVDIQLDCSQTKIPTDGLVLKGWYTTITLAVYGILSKGIQTTVPPVPIPERQRGDLSASAATAEWVQQHAQVSECPPDTMYIDQNYSYPPDYQSSGHELGYVEYSVPPPPAGTLPHTEVHTYDSQQTPQVWDNSCAETKPWSHSVKDEIKSELVISPNCSVGEAPRDWAEKRERNKWDSDRNSVRDEKDDKEKREKYWDENMDPRDDDRPKDRREKDSDREDRSRRSDKEWRDEKERYRRREDGESSYERDRDRERERDRDRDRYHREKDRKRDDDSREEDRSRRKERERSGLREGREERTRERSMSSVHGRRERDRSVDRGSWAERNAEPSDNRIRSGKNYKESSWERDKEKSPYSEASSYRRRPRSPPSRSPKRPYTPTERFYSPERREYSSPSARQTFDSGDSRRRSPAALSPVIKPTEALKIDTSSVAKSPQTPLVSPMKYTAPPALSQSPAALGQSPLAQGEPTLDDEAYEPILSDEEDIIEESDSQYPDIDYDFPDDMEEVVRPFNPFTFQVQPLQMFLDSAMTLCEKEQILRKRLTPDTRKLSIEEEIERTLKSVSCDDSNMKEDWVVAVELLLTLLDRGLNSIAVESQAGQTLLSWVDLGLNFEAALLHSSPGFKLRHIKAGVRLVEVVCLCGGRFPTELVTCRGVQRKLLLLYHQEYMALSIKLLILKALDSTLQEVASMQFFLTDKFPLESANNSLTPYTGYQHVLKMLERKQLVRAMFALTSLLRKVHTFETLQKMEKSVNELVSKEDTDVEHLHTYLQDIDRMYSKATWQLSQPRRFLPLKAQFDINLESPTAYLFLYRLFRHQRFLEQLCVLSTHRRTSNHPPIALLVQSILKQMSDRMDGLIYLSSCPDVTNNLLKILYGQTEEYLEPMVGTSSCFAMELACRLQVLQVLDKLTVLRPVEENCTALFDLLHELFSVSFSPVGKSQIAFVLALEDNIQVLLNIVKNCSKKSAVKNYAFDLIILTVKYSDDVPFLKKYGKAILELAEADRQSKLFEIVAWVKPLELSNLVSYDDTGPLCDIIKRHTSLESPSALPGDLITGVRVLRYLGVPSHESDLAPGLEEDEELSELKYKYMILQLHSLDGLSHLTAVLSKVLEYYEQPFAHCTSLLGSQGTMLMAFLEPAVALLRRMLTYVIAARNSDYKDLTHVPVLIQVYTLMQAFQPNAEAFGTAQKVSRDIVETLLSYTQPLAKENATENETFTKSLWTLMVSDVLKYITKFPFSFIPGFMLLSELLPLPIPIPSKSDLPKGEVELIVNSRKLWSAHLHSLSAGIHDLVATMAGSSYPPLLALVRRVCLQLADLASPSALVISRAVLDPLLATLQRPASPGTTGGTWEVPCTSHSLRLLNFLACLLSHASIKAAVLNLLTGGNNTAKTDEHFLTLVNGFTTILRTPCNVPTHTHVQEHVILIIQAFFDTDVTLVPFTAVEPGPEVSVNDIFLANSMPSRDLLSTFIAALLDHVAVPEHGFSTVLSTIKSFLLLTEHDYGFYHLKSCIDSKGEAMWSLLVKICSGISRDNADSINVLFTLLDLFRDMVTISAELSPARTLFMTVSELASVVRWGCGDKDKAHPIQHMGTLLKEWSEADDALTSLSVNLQDLVKLLNGESNKPQPEAREFIEPVLPAPMSLKAQFTCRPVYVIGETDEKRLSAVYWLSQPPCEDCDQELDQITVDLMEVSRIYLPDLHLPHEVERICMLKTSDDDEDPKKQQDSKFQLSGLKTRRPFITPMRGRGVGRGAPQRGDLFRSRPPNTSRPPSLHVDDFVALETCGQQPTGPTGYNKISNRAVKDILASRTRGRGRAYAPDRGRFFGATTYPRRDSPRGLSRGRGSWLQHAAAEEVAVSRALYAAESRDLRVPLRSDSVGRYLTRESIFKDFF